MVKEEAGLGSPYPVMSWHVGMHINPEEAQGWV
jgi:hypothetical protein